MNQRFLVQQYPDQAAVDGAYNPDLAAVDLAASRAHIAAQGEKARATLEHRLNVAYGPTLEETLDIFPAAQPGSPVLVFLHGGYWRANHARHFHGVALGPVAAGFTTVVVNYALCPFVTLDEIVRQTRASLVWIRRHIAQYHGDGERVYVSGHSAGGQLTAMSLLTPWQRDYGLHDHWLAGGLAISGLYELAALRYSYLQPLIQLDDGVIRRQSPLPQVRRCATPVRITWGGAETAEFARQSQAFHAAWQAAGNTAVLAPVPGAHHFSAIHGFETPDGDLAGHVADFFR